MKKIFKFVIPIILFQSVFYLTAAQAWDENHSLSGVDGQTVGSDSSVTATIDLKSLHGVLIWLKVVPDGSVTEYTYYVKASTDGGNNFSNDNIVLGTGSTITTDTLIRVTNYMYPMIQVSVVNSTAESGNLTVTCNYATY